MSETEKNPAMDGEGTVEAPKVTNTMRKIDVPQDKVFRVASGANVKDLAWAIAKALDEGFRPILVGIGVQAVSQAVKSIAVANSRLASQGKLFTILPAFENSQIPDQNTKEQVERTLIKLILVPYRF